MMNLSNNQATYSAAVMYAINLIFIVAVSYVFIDGIHSDGFIESAMEMWKSQDSRLTMEFSFLLMGVNLSMLIITLIGKSWHGIKLYLLTILSWCLVLSAFVLISVDLVLTYLLAAGCLTIRAYNQRKIVIRA